MTDPILLELVSSSAPPYKVEIKELYLPAHNGKAGVLENHLPYISLVKPGEVYYRDTGGRAHYLYIKEGFLEVLKNKITLISDSLEKGEELDRSTIEEKLAEIDEFIKTSLALPAKHELSDEELKNSWKETEKSLKKFEEALEQQKEYKAKLAILDKIEKK